MFVDNDNLAKKINIAGKKKWCKACTEIFDQFLPISLFLDDERKNGKDLITHNVSSTTFNRLKERIEMLESQNDKLHQYISFLIENLPDLIIKTIHADLNVNHVFEYAEVSAQIERQKETFFNGARNIPFPTRREKDVLELLAKGYCAKEIAKQLFISETTVITHKKNLKKKFNVKNTVELVSKIRNGL